MVQINLPIVKDGMYDAKVCKCVCIYQIAHNRAIRPCHPSHYMPLALTCACVFIELDITAQSGPIILVILCHSHFRVCVCVFKIVIPFILDARFVDVPAGGHPGGRSHRISPPSFCGACLNFSREKDSAVPFPRRPSSRIVCINELIVLNLLDIFFFFL